MSTNLRRGDYSGTKLLGKSLPEALSPLMVSPQTNLIRLIMNKFPNLSAPWLVLVLAAFFALAACQQETEPLAEAEAQALVVDAVTALEDSAQCGQHGCFEFVFPITIGFADSTTAAVNSPQELRAAVYTWVQANPNTRPRLHFVYPLDVVDSDGDLITITSSAELRALRASCGRGFRGPRHRGRLGFGNLASQCFTLSFPTTLYLPSVGRVTVDDRQNLHQTIRRWRSSHPHATTRPYFTFPMTVTLADGTTQTLPDRAALRALKQSCQSN